MAFPRVPDREMAVIYKLQVGLTRSGEAVLEGDIVENVLGDVPHKACLRAFATLAKLMLEEMLTKHFGEESTEEEVQAYFKQKAGEEDLDLSFFDREVEISDE